MRETLKKLQEGTISTRSAVCRIANHLYHHKNAGCLSKAFTWAWQIVRLENQEVTAEVRAEFSFDFANEVTALATYKKTDGQQITDEPVLWIESARVAKTAGDEDNQGDLMLLYMRAKEKDGEWKKTYGQIYLKNLINLKKVIK